MAELFKACYCIPALLVVVVFTICLCRTLLDRVALLHDEKVVWIVDIFISLSTQTLIKVYSVVQEKRLVIFGLCSLKQKDN